MDLPTWDLREYDGGVFTILAVVTRGSALRWDAVVFHRPNASGQDRRHAFGFPTDREARAWVETEGLAEVVETALQQAKD